MLSEEKDLDNGINIKFGKDKDGRGEYRAIKKREKELNGNAKVTGTLIF